MTEFTGRNIGSRIFQPPAQNPLFRAATFQIAANRRRDEMREASVNLLLKKVEARQAAKQSAQEDTKAKTIMKINLREKQVKKPPFIVPGRLKYNDRYLLQPLVPSEKPFKKKIPVIKTDKPNQVQAATKKIEKIESVESDFEFIAPNGIAAIEIEDVQFPTAAERRAIQHNVLPLACYPGLMANNITSTPMDTRNPWVEDNLRFTVKNQYTSLSQPSPVPQAPSFPTRCFSPIDVFGESGVKAHYQLGPHPCTEAIAPEFASIEERTIMDVLVDPSNCAERGSIKVETPKRELLLEDHLKAEIAQKLRIEMDEVTSRLEQYCHIWNRILREGDTEHGLVPDNEHGSLFTVIQQTQLLKNERFQQYAKLIEEYEASSSVKPINPSDLQGFWEMILQQVEDIEKKFAALDVLRLDGWIRRDVDVGTKRKKKSQMPLVGEPSGPSLDTGKKKPPIRQHIDNLRKENLKNRSSIGASPETRYRTACSPSACLSNTSPVTCESSNLCGQSSEAKDCDFLTPGTCVTNFSPSSPHC